MRLALIILCLALIASCNRRKPQVIAAAPPPPPIVRTAAPLAAPEPLSMPQTEVTLPPAQPIPEDVVILPPSEPAGQPPEKAGPKPARRTPEPKPEVAVTPPVEPPPPQPRIRALISPADQQRLERSIAQQKREIQERMARAQAAGSSSERRAMIDRIQSFLDLSAEAEKQGDLREAEALAARALALARDLSNAP